MSMRGTAGSRGFTLVELLVCVLILSILASLLVATVSSWIERSKGTLCINNMRQLYTAFMVYSGEHNGWFPPGRKIEPGEDLPNWKAYLYPNYLSDVPYCPSLRLGSRGRQSVTSNVKAYIQNTSGYHYNAYLLIQPRVALPGPLWSGHPYPGDAKMLFLLEGPTSGGIWEMNSPCGMALDGWAADFWAPRNHGTQKLNYCFMDGRIEVLARPLKEDGKTPDWNQLFDTWGRDGKYVPPRSPPPYY